MLTTPQECTGNTLKRILVQLQQSKSKIVFIYSMEGDKQHSKLQFCITFFFWTNCNPLAS